VSGIPQKAGWLTYALLTMVLWGVWGAYAGLPTERGFPETLNYVVWALTMIVPAVWTLRAGGYAFAKDRKSVSLGLAIGLLGAGGQLLLFYTLRQGPAYLIFPIISLSPLITIGLSVVVLGERTRVLAMVALPLFDYQSSSDGSHFGAWFALALLILGAWGMQAYFIKIANNHMNAQSIFAYMTLSGLLLCPVALLMTDFSQPINWGLGGPGLAAAIQMLNALGALTLVYAFRYGKVISLAIAHVMPPQTKIIAIVFAIIAAILLAIEPESPKTAEAVTR
jgi:uncharacterized membrane protein